MPKEASIVRSIVTAATSMGWLCIKQHGSAFSRLGTPDLLCLRAGRAVWLEVKQPGKKPTPIQLAMMRRLELEAQTPCFVVTSRREAEVCLRQATT